MEFRKNIYADFWVNGKFIEENTWQLIKYIVYFI
jgi:hypothetical protein